MRLTEVLFRAARRERFRCFKRFRELAPRYPKPLNFREIGVLRQRLEVEARNMDHLKRPYLTVAEDLIADKYATTLYAGNDTEVAMLKRVKFLEPVSYEDRLTHLRSSDKWE